MRNNSQFYIRLFPTIIIFFCLIAQSFALSEFEVHKLFQYSDNSNSYGSQRASFSLLATFPTITVDNPQRRIMLLPFSELYTRIVNYEEKEEERKQVELEKKEEINEEIKEELEKGIIINTATTKDEEYQKEIFGEVGGVLIIINKNENIAKFPGNFDWESSLLSHKLTVPIYFIEDSPELQRIARSARNEHISTPSSPSEFIDWILSDSHLLSLSSTEPYPLKPIPTFSNLHAYVLGGTGSSTIVIMGNYDTFAASVGLAKGTQSASSTAGVLELLRLFNNLYNGSKLQAKFNFLFVLSSGYHFDFLSARKFLLSLDDKTRSSIDFVFTLPSLLSQSEEEKITLFASRPAKDPTAHRLYSSFNKTAEQMKINFEVKISKVNLVAKERWEYEVFSKERILAATLSSSPSSYSSPPLFSHSSVFDSEEIKTELLMRNIRFVAESLAKFIFSSPDNNNNNVDSLSIFEGALAPNSHYVEGWVKTLLKEQRVGGYIKEDLTNNIERTMRLYTIDVMKKTFPIDNYSFFSLPTTNTMTVSLVKPFVFDVALSLVLFACLYLFFLFLKYMGDSILDF